MINTYKSMDYFIKIEKDFHNDLQNIEKILDKMIENEPLWFREVIEHLLKAGGKRIRPLLVCLSSSLVSNQVNDKAIKMAAIVEFVHNASLLHDDVIDEGLERRGKPTVNKIYGNRMAVLGGDFILSKVFSELLKLNSPDALYAMIEAIEKLVAGEILEADLEKRDKEKITFDEYNKLIYLKTSSLFEWTMTAGGYSCEKSEDIINSLKDIGNHIGKIFQIVDDILDYTGSKVFGKKTFQDFSQGKVTLPLLFLFKEDKEYLSKWKKVLENKDEKELEKVGKEFLKRINKPDIQLEMNNYLQKEVDGIRNILVNKFSNSKYIEHFDGLVKFLVARII